MDLPSELPKEVQSCQCFEFCPVIMVAYFWTPELWENKCVFSVTKFVVISQGSHRELTHGCKQRLLKKACRVNNKSHIWGMLSDVSLLDIWSGNVEKRVGKVQRRVLSHVGKFGDYKKVICSTAMGPDDWDIQKEKSCCRALDLLVLEIRNIKRNQKRLKKECTGWQEENQARIVPWKLMKTVF